jgi:oligopeptidase B
MTQARPPVAKRVPQTFTLHGDERVDDYHWLRDRADPDTVPYLEAENAYLEAVMAPLADLRETLYTEMRARIQESDLEVPARRGEFWYYSRTEEGKQYRVHCRKRGSLEGTEEVLLDLNAVAQDGGYGFLQLGGMAVSEDGTRVAYLLDTDGSERYRLHVKDIETGEVIATIADAYYGLEWSADGEHLFFVRADTQMRPHQIWRHTLGAGTPDSLVLEEPDETFFLWLSKTRSRAWLRLTARAGVTTEVCLIPSDAPLETPRLFKARERGLEYSVEHLPDTGFLVRHNSRGAVNFMVSLAPEGNTADQNAGLEGWTTWLAHSPARLVSAVMPFRSHVVVWGREGGFTQFWVHGASGAQHITMPHAAVSVYPGTNLEFDAPAFRLQYTSLAQPRQVIDVDLATLGQTVLKTDPVLGGYDPDAYVTERLEVTSTGGARVPVSVIYKRGALEGGPARLYLYGYGAYGISLDPYFSSNRVSLLDRGVVFAIAHVRGGQELGRQWYEDGKLLGKLHSFEDFIACAEHLIAEGYTSSPQLAISGASAGGLLVGACVTMRPELFKVVVAAVPFVDVVTTMLDTSLPLTTNEYDEWGNPNDPLFYQAMRAYSPYDQTVSAAYPNLFITAGLNDPRVSYHEPAKWIAKLRAVDTGDNTLVLHTNMGAGHGGSSGRFDALREVALEYAFVLDRLGVK